MPTLRLAKGELVTLSRTGVQRRRQRLVFPPPDRKPFLKWAGGKQWLAPLAAALTPPRFTGTYFEPFLGGGAVFFALAPSAAVLSDLNHELIATYDAVKSDVEAVIAELSGYPHNEAFYKQLRASNPQSAVSQAARLIYLNRTAFNGMYRVNADGLFNVPFGRFVNPMICPSDRLRNAATRLQSVRLATCDFDSVQSAEPGDWVFFDPPYTTGHQNNGFRKYNAHLFSWADQHRLATVAETLRQRGVHVLISNAYHPAILALYKSWTLTRASRRSAVASLSSSRGQASEVLISSYRLRKLLG
jgi:DNA adenine methylase